MKIKKISIALIAALAFFSHTYAEQNVLPIAESASLSGVMEMKSFTHPNTGKIVKVPVLILDSPINVSADAYGEANQHISYIQLAFQGNYSQYLSIKRKYLHKKVLVTGELQHATVATQHYTDVYMEVSSIKTNK